MQQHERFNGPSAMTGKTCRADLGQDDLSSALLMLKMAR
jgi:hypothetical protein